MLFDKTSHQPEFLGEAFPMRAKLECQIANRAALESWTFALSSEIWIFISKFVIFYLI